eukprot:TRINITY_DN2314_c0_g1_i1.p1 TRINITY_DN2314_c0_g1~~TRINITY_DN2314_c0_g1_i1.p1  ORF type:complete len:101 (-),score=10.31 TRINITY_DN2314_c0_g1_i1:97-399(-)
MKRKRGPEAVVESQESCTARYPAQLSFEKGEIMELLDTFQGWYRCRKYNGKIGMVPQKSVQIVSQNKQDNIDNQRWIMERKESQSGDITWKRKQIHPMEM